MFKKIKNFLMVSMAVLTLIGVVTFSMFILEESLQTIMFGTWAAQDAKNWEHVQRGADAMRVTNRVLKIVTYGFGWVNPFAFISYKHYSKATDYYIGSLESKILAQAPHLMAGRKVTMEFRPKSADKLENGGYVLRAGRFSMYSETADLSPRPVTGMLEVVNGRLFIKS
jgi:hypothetical protein